MTTISQQEMYANYCKDIVTHNKEKRKECRKCGKCGYFMRYVRHDGTPDHDGDCACIEMNKECNDGHNPFEDNNYYLVQVDENEDACALFKKNRTRRVEDYIKKHPQFYVQTNNFVPKPVR